MIRGLNKNSYGFTLIESLISIGIFVLLIVAINETASAIVRSTINFRQSATISGLADNYMELARNLPYSQIGTWNGNPYGNLPDLPNAINVSLGGVTYQIYYSVSYVDDTADGTILAGTDASPNDYKQIKLYVTNTATNAVAKFLSTISPKGLESMNNAGALSIEVFDAVGTPVPNATIVITNTSVFPQINLTRTSDASGNWIEVGLPNSNQDYHVVVSKNGYSTDQTYPISGGNPNPTKPDATILTGQVTQISFSIDRVSSLILNTLDETCNAIPNVGVGIAGAKIIGTPSVLKFNNSYSSNGDGQVILNPLEWDSYTPALIPSSYMIYGSSPIQQISVLPNTNQMYTLILGPKTTNSLLIIVKDASTGNPIKGATVDLISADHLTDASKLTSGSVWSQNAWSGGPNQINFTDSSKYFQSDGTIDVSAIPSGIRLVNYGGPLYATSGTLTSSTFDTGSNESFYTMIDWQPSSQGPTTNVKFQIATNNDNATWDYVGPDGTAGTYFTVPGTAINEINNNKQFIRYRTFLGTTDTTVTPVITSIGLNYVSGCFTPGQAMFPGLSSSTNYDVTISLSGYQTQTISGLEVSGYQVLEVLLNP